MCKIKLDQKIIFYDGIQSEFSSCEEYFSYVRQMIAGGKPYEENREALYLIYAGFAFYYQNNMEAEAKILRNTVAQEYLDYYSDYYKGNDWSKNYTVEEFDKAVIKFSDTDNWIIKIRELGSPGSKSWQNDTLELKGGCIQYFIHDFGETVSDFFGDDGEDNEYEAWYGLNKEESIKFLKELGAYGFVERDVFPIVKDKIKSRFAFDEICKKLGIQPSFGSWR